MERHFVVVWAVPISFILTMHHKRSRIIAALPRRGGESGDYVAKRVLLDRDERWSTMLLIAR